MSLRLLAFFRKITHWRFMSISDVYAAYRNNRQMRPIATDGIVSSVCLSVCLLVTFVSPAKTAEPIEMPFGGWLGWAQGTSIRWGPDSLRCTGNFWGCPAYNSKNWKASHGCIVLCKKSITASQRHCCSDLQCCRLVGVILCCPREISVLCDTAYRPNSLTIFLKFTLTMLGEILLSRPSPTMHSRDVYAGRTHRPTT